MNNKAPIHLSVFLLAVFAIIFPSFISRAEDKLSLMNIIAAVGVSGCLLLVPAVFAHPKKWFLQESVIIVYMLLLLTILSKILGPQAGLLIYPCIFMTIAALLIYIKRMAFNRTQFLLLALGFVVGCFLVFLTYSVYAKWYYMDNIYSGNVHIDILFHSSICNSFDIGNPSTLLDGNAPFRYHWGSHLLFNGLKNMIGISGFQFYNLMYPAIFIPLFLYALFLFMESYFHHSKAEATYIYFLILAFIAIYFSLDKFSYLGQPVGSESFTLSLMFSFLTLAVVFKMDEEKFSVFKLLFFMASVVLIYFCKISTGLLMACGLSYLYIRKERNLKSVLLMGLMNILVFALVYIVIFPHDRVQAHDSLIHRYLSVWKHSEGIFDYLSGLLILLFFIFYKREKINLSGIRNYMASSKYVYFEFLALISILGLLGAWAVSNHGNDVIYFSSVQLYLCFPVFVYLLYLLMEKLQMHTDRKIILLAFIAVLSILSKPEAFKSLTDNQKILEEGTKNYTSSYSQLARRLKELYKTEDRKQTCIYIPLTETWFFKGLKPDVYPYRDDIESVYIVPALSGMALIGGIPQSVLDSDYPYYGVYYHRLQRPKQVMNDAEAQASAKAFGYKKMIKFTEQENKLLQQVIAL